MKTLTYPLIILSVVASIGTAGANEAECRAIAQREYPNDPHMQQFVYNQQLAAYRYMSTVTVTDADVKEIALREYPEDFVMQKFTMTSKAQRSAT